MTENDFRKIIQEVKERDPAAYALLVKNYRSGLIEKSKESYEHLKGKPGGEKAWKSHDEREERSKALRQLTMNNKQ